jgi:hypothetical protein
VRLFSSDENYRETRLMRDPFRPAIYVTLDFWDSRNAYEKFMATRKQEYKEADAVGEELTSNERCVGWFEKVEP